MQTHKLVLKEKAPIILLRNMDAYNGHCNARKYVVNHRNDHVIDATVAGGINIEKRQYIPRRCHVSPPTAGGTFVDECLDQSREFTMFL